MKAPARNANLGFTLIELLITVSIAVILATVVVPSFQSALQRNRFAGQANEFISALNIARSEAIKRGSRVTVCKSADEASCASTGDWTQGWVIFQDANENGTVDSGEQVISVHEPLDSGFTLTGAASDMNNYVSFVGTGGAEKNDGSPQSGDLTMSQAGSGDSRTISLSTTGRVHVESP